MSQIRDREIIAQMRAGKEEGLRLLLEAHGGCAKQYVKARFGSSLDGQEMQAVVNEAAYDAWRFSCQFDARRGEVRHWFLGIIRNVALNALRRRQDSRALPPEFPDPFLVNEPPQERSRLLEDLEEAIAQLPPLQKAIIRADLEAGGTADNEVLARTQGTSANSIRVSRNKARRICGRNCKSGDIF